MHPVARFSCFLALALLLSGCSPALFVRLLNATGDSITVSNTSSKKTLTIPPGTGADVSLHDPREQLFIRSSRALWSYSFREFYQPRWPLSLWEQHAGVMRIYARLDSRGRIYVWTPPGGSQAAHEIQQPTGFPLRPHET